MLTSVVDLCLKNNVTVEQLAERSGLDYNRVAAIVSGRWTPSPEERKKIADQFGMTIHEIGWGHSTPIQHIYGH
jgi:transcriptional regulator with XRE-family HTH domain